MFIYKKNVRKFKKKKNLNTTKSLKLKISER